MTVRTHSLHSVGHTLFSIGALVIVFSCIVMSPVNSARSLALNARPIIDLTNQTRERLDKPGLEINYALMSAAQAKAEHMVKNRYFAHFAPDGTSPWNFMTNASYSYEVAGENLAITNEDESAVITGWLNSPTHKENMLSTSYSHIGIGIASYGDYQGNKNTTVIVAMYGAPKRSSAMTAVAGSVDRQTTNPAGTIAVLKPSLFGNDYGVYIGLIGAALLVAGAALELRHIHAHHLASMRTT